MKETFVLTVEALEKKYNYLRKIGDENAAVQRLKWEWKAAKRAVKNIGLVEQAKSAVTELDAINALANYEANKRGEISYYSKGYSVWDEWYHAFQHCLNFESVFGIWEKDWLDEDLFTVGEYLELVEVSKPQAVKRESYADTARKIGDFWKFAFTSQNRKQYTENCAEKNVL